MAARGPDVLETRKVGVDDGADRGRVTERCDAADRHTGVGADEVRGRAIEAVQPQGSRQVCRVHPVPTGGHDQQGQRRAVRRDRREDQGVGDLGGGDAKRVGGGLRRLDGIRQHPEIGVITLLGERTPDGGHGGMGGQVETHPADCNGRLARGCRPARIRVHAVGSSSTTRLQPRLVHQTVLRLGERIHARFPARGLNRVAEQLAELAAEVEERGPGLRRRMLSVSWFVRIIGLVVLVGTGFLLLITIRDAIRHGPDQSFEWVPLIESLINDLVFAGIALFFLMALPERIQRRELLATLHRLRSLAHIVDMHQLTKDPERLRPDFVKTSMSADPGLDRDELEHYLDYCSELLSLIGKVAALCAEESEDAVVLDTISTIEAMTTDMSGKIWQKISLLPR